jgi:hypothetical protein
MTTANIRSEWVNGNLVFKNVAGEILLTVDQSAGLIGSINPRVLFTAGENLTAGQLIYISGWDATAGRYAMKLADADAANPAKCALFVCESTVALGAVGVAVGEATLSAQNTNSAVAVGDPVYLGTTAGAWTLTAPTGGGHCVQQVGVVAVKSATVGVIKLFPFYSKTVTVNT